MYLVRTCKIVAPLAFFFASQAAFATIAFEDFPHAEDLQGVGTILWTHGYVLSYVPAPGEPFPTGFTAVGPSWEFNAGSTAIAANSVGALTTLVRGDSKPFAIFSVDLAELNGPGAVTVIFQGTKPSGETVSQTFSLDGTRGFQRFFFSSEFWNVISVQWLQGDFVSSDPHMFDNLAVLPFENPFVPMTSRSVTPFPAAGITFEDLDGSAEIQGVGSTYSFDGYTFSYTLAPLEPFPGNSYFYTAGSSWQFNNGSTALFGGGTGPSLTTLKRDDGQPFTPVSIDLAELNGPGATKVIFRGTTVSGDYVWQGFMLDGKTGFQRFLFPKRFRNVVAIQWEQGDAITNNPHMFDNVVVLPASN